MLNLSQTLTYYKRKDVIKLLVDNSHDKEIGTRFPDDSFGKRPDVINYENDVLEFAKRGVSSFHCSEELWNNPLQLNTNMKKTDIEELRKGWDLILDIDCPYWPLAKIITYVFIKSLKDHKINCVTVKFSGGKGFHISVPFESFPETVTMFNDATKKTVIMPVKDLFPDGPRKIAKYLLQYIEKNLIIINDKAKIINFAKVKMTYAKFQEITGKSEDQLMIKICKKCHNVLKELSEEKTEYICPNCEYRLEDKDKDFVMCPKCRKIMEKKFSKKSLCECGSNEYEEKLDLRKIVDVDTVLISSRHLYRMQYSLHEKTGLVSVPFDIKHILNFEKEEAKTSSFKPHKFLDRSEAIPGEATSLFQKAFESGNESTDRDRINIIKNFKRTKDEIVSQGLQLEQEAIPEEFFPPCIKKISQGLEDGKKRALFILINFLGSCNWNYEQIEQYIMKWNEKNKPDQLRETYVRGQLRYFKTQKEKMPPPNCDNRGYMIDTGFCNPDGLCKRIKNPAQYAKRKTWMMNNAQPKKRVKKSEEKIENTGENNEHNANNENKNVRKKTDDSSNQK